MLQADAGIGLITAINHCRCCKPCGQPPYFRVIATQSPDWCCKPPFRRFCMRLRKPKI